MRQSAQQGENRTGILRAGALGEEIVRATREFPPSSAGTSQAIADVRVAYAQEDESFGEPPAPPSVAGKAKSAITALTGGQPTLLMDKLGERLAFEHAGARLNEALLSKHEAYGSFPGGPTAEDVRHILTEEYEHADILERAIKELGGDPTVLTPSANLAANISAGLPQVLSDPRTNLLQSLEAILVAELSDNECWSALEELAGQAGHDALMARCREALMHEAEHLQKVRTWIAAGQGRDTARPSHTNPGAWAGASRPSTTAETAEESSDQEFTFSDKSPVDREGYVVSEEEAAEGGTSDDRSKNPRRGAGDPAARRDQ
jgi:hypothetical protein